MNKYHSSINLIFDFDTFHYTFWKVSKFLVNPCFFHSIHYSYPFKKSADFRLYYYCSKKRRALKLKPAFYQLKILVKIIYFLSPFQNFLKCDIMYMRIIWIFRLQWCSGTISHNKISWQFDKLEFVGGNRNMKRLTKNNRQP